jgi:hypothetical protein
MTWPLKPTPAFLLGQALALAAVGDHWTVALATIGLAVVSAAIPSTP